MPPPAASTPQEPRRGEHHRVDPDGDEKMGEINVIFIGSMFIASKTKGKKLERGISLAYHLKTGRRIKWSDADISFGPDDHPDTELSERNLPFVVKLPIGLHNVAKTLIDNGASLNLFMRNTFIKMALNISDLVPVHDMFHGVILGQSSTPIGRIDLKVSCGTGDNKCKEMLTFEVASFDICYICILGRPFLLKFMAVIHTAHVTMKMPGQKGMIVIKVDQCNALACENTTLTQAGRFGEKVTEAQVAKMAKTSDGGTPFRSQAPKPQTTGTPQPPLAKKGTHVASGSNQPPTDQ
jgi:hypothetical protein